MMVAAIAVILFCAAGIAAIAGWIPTSRSDTHSANEPGVTESASVPPAPAAKAPVRAAPPAQPAAEPRPAERVARSQPPAAEPRAPVQVAAEPSAPPTPAICFDCGTVASVREVKQSGEGSGIGAVAGGVAGAVLGNQVGGGRGRDIATVVGAVGGAVAGHQVEKHVKSGVAYEIAVTMDDGNNRTFTQSEPPAWRPGDKVRVEGDRLTVRG
ncbi:MAG: glycine zipper 2TM domain-containing protein [Betaproteobacteria bacterium]|nr:glycine zipper 2TM domain-containing protein [Betaproteobacteria bacterium]